MSRIFEIFTKTSDLKLVGKMTRNIFKMRLATDIVIFLKPLRNSERNFIKLWL